MGELPKRLTMALQIVHIYSPMHTEAFSRLKWNTTIVSSLAPMSALRCQKPVQRAFLYSIALIDWDWSHEHTCVFRTSHMHSGLEHIFVRTVYGITA